MSYQVELVWNREFNFVPFMDPFDNLDEAILGAREIESSGDGARVKKSRVVTDDGTVVWANGVKL